MKCLQVIFMLIFICCNTFLVFAQNITVDDSYNAQQLVENVLVNSSCANVSNSKATGDNIVPIGQNSYGYFTNAGASFPFTEGVLLSTSYAKKSIGPFSTNPVNITGNDNDSGWVGDADLNQAIGISTSVTATVLEFDFIPLTNFLSFDYIFASIEYNDTGSCSFTDGFAFLIKENISGSVYVNLAVIPGTQLPVSSTNIRPTIPPSGNNIGCPSVNPEYFNGFNNSTSPINYAAQTVVMNSQTAVVAGKSYHIKLVIANDKNEYYDSAVFLKAGSFAPKINLGPDQLASSNPICYGETFTIDTKFPATYNFKWFKDGALISGETSPILNVTLNGTYKVEVLFTPATCMATDEIRIEFAPEIILSDTTLAECDDNGDGITIFNLTKIDNLIKNNNAALSPVVYYESLTLAQTKTNPILNPSAYQNKLAVATLFARVSNTFGCVNYAQVSLVIANNSIATQNPISTCDGDAIQDGLYQFNLNAQVSPQIISSTPPGMLVEYYSNTTDAIVQKNSLPNIFKNSIPNQQIIYFRIVNGPNCFGIAPITLKVNAFNPPNFQDETISICDGFSANLTVSPSYSSYLWNTGGATNSITVSTGGNYSVIVSDVNGCTKTKKFIVPVSGIATITDASIKDFTGVNNSVLLQFIGKGVYEFSLDGFSYQDNPLFVGVSPGKYFATARDKNGCGISNPYLVYVLDYPRFFTPNGDGINDEWRIKNIELFPNAIINIFDRYGKLIKELNIANYSWNGKYTGRELPSDDYWFHLNFDGNKIIKGHFSLKR
jgi:gliding motility-associated-like protein